MEKKNYTWKLDTVIIEQLQLRAEAENRSLTNFIEWIFRAAIISKPASLPILNIQSNPTTLEAPGSTITTEPMVAIQKESKAVENVYDVRFISNNYKDKMMQIGTWTNKEPILFRAEKLEVGDKITVTKHKKE